MRPQVEPVDIFDVLLLAIRSMFSVKRRLSFSALRRQLYNLINAIRLSYCKLKGV